LRGKEALAFARDRHSLPAGDFGRSEDGGRLIIAALTQLRKEFNKDPSRLLTWIAGGLRNVRPRPRWTRSWRSRSPAP
ncbi:MAG TPA: hypothetical protein VNA32_10625, partial [Actinomycetota bacterium]|nr:hypothetical protein [Actinomycetota bacterium]